MEVFITDKTTARFTHFLPINFLKKIILDERDETLLYSILGLTIYVALSAYLIFSYTTYFTWWVSILYILITLAGLGGHYVLLLHVVSHRKLFTKKFNLLNLFVSCILGPFFGSTPTSYAIHHLGMHHRENNNELDESSTLAYQRDKLSHWAHYWLRFILFGDITTLSYLRYKNSMRLYKLLLIGEITWLAVIVCLAYYNFYATFLLFILPVFLTRTLLMMGNWGQHAFVDVDDYQNPYKYSVTLVNSNYNRTCFNDGYHIEHHKKPGLHWTEMPVEFRKSISDYQNNRAIVLKGIHGGFVELWFYVVFKKYNYLAKRWIISDTGLSHEQKVEIIKTRLRKRVGNIKSICQM